MGNFFTSSQIYNNENWDKQQFIDKFTNAMSDNGYTVCDSDESEMSYILRFADNSKWVAVTSESYEQGGRPAQADAGRIAKMLCTYCMNTPVIDSDCAAMFLYSKDGNESDMLLMGRYDDYFGDDIHEPNEKIWTRFLSDGCTWEQFTEILGGEYVFVEEGLAKLAPVIGMDSDNLLFSAEDDIDDEFAVFLDFKKVEAKKQKKLTLKSAFTQVFGEALEPYGFKLLKSKYPYYLRVVDEDIIQAISFAKEKSLTPDPNRNEEGVTIYFGIALLINPLINFDKNPTIIDNQRLMISMSDLYGNFIAHMDDFNEKHEAYTFFFTPKEILKKCLMH